MKDITIRMSVVECGCIEHEIQKCSHCIDILQQKKTLICEQDEVLREERISGAETRIEQIESRLETLIEMEEG